MKRIYLYIIVLITCIVGYAWLGYVLSQSQTNSVKDINVCLIKNVLHIPCPSCGSTRAVLALWNGNPEAAFLINPFGLIISSILIVAPLWIIFDVLRNKKSFYNIYQKTEETLKKKQYSIPLIALVIGNWIWNIIKNQ